jgi:periplasmic protein TonB
MLMQRPPDPGLPPPQDVRRAPSTRVREPGERRSRLRLAGAISLSLHVALLAALLLWLRHPQPSTDVPPTPGAVELVLVEKQGATPTAPPEAAPSAVPAPPPQPEPPPPPPSDTATADEALPLPPPPVPPPAAPSVQQPDTPPLQQAQEAPQINLAGNSDTNAIVSGPNVVPASIDDRSRNRPPVYPPEAVRRAEQGKVILLIHVSAEGLARGVDIAQSSGFVLLDNAAREAVARWHFLPAVQDGQPIPFDMALQVVFHLD